MSQNAKNMQSLATCAWTLSAVIAIVSTKALLVDRNYHYPLHLLSLQLAAVTSVHFIRRIIISRRGGHEGWTTSNSTSTDTGGGVVAIIAPKLGSVAMAIGLPMFMQAILHFPNLPTLIMMFPLAFLVEMIATHFKQGQRPVASIAVPMLVPVMALSLLLFDEYRLEVNGLLFGIPAIALLGLSTALETHPRSDDNTVMSTFMSRWSLNFTIPCVFAINFLWILVAESPLSAFKDLKNAGFGLLVLNILFSAISFVLGNSLVSPPAFNSSDSNLRDDIQFPSQERLISNVALTGIASFTFILFTRRAYSSPFQVIAYVVVMLWFKMNGRLPRKLQLLLSREKIGYRPVARNSSDTDIQPLEVARDSSESQPLPQSVKTSIFAIVALFWFLFLGMNFVGFSAVRPVSSPKTNLDLVYEPPSDLDVVVSMYKEPVEDVKELFENLKRIPAVQERSPRLIIYLKDGHADADAIKQQTGASIVTKLPNVGREAAAYLHHIVEEWQTLANHTFFLQAHIHNGREFYPRIRNYYSEHTGMLSLGFPGNICSNCEQCGDRWGWFDNSDIIPMVYRKAYYGTVCNAGPVLLSYKGQFIVSAARIRGARKTLYESLLQALVDPDSWSHKSDYLQDRPDSMNAPFFGYTMERMWSILFQCSELDLAWKCPSLLSGGRTGGRPEDCQCHDVISVSDDR